MHLTLDCHLAVPGWGICSRRWATKETCSPQFAEQNWNNEWTKRTLITSMTGDLVSPVQFDQFEASTATGTNLWAKQNLIAQWQVAMCTTILKASTEKKQTNTFVKQNRTCWQSGAATKHRTPMHYHGYLHKKRSWRSGMNWWNSSVTSLDMETSELAKMMWLVKSGFIRIGTLFEPKQFKVAHNQVWLGMTVSHSPQAK